MKVIEGILTTLLVLYIVSCDPDDTAYRIERAAAPANTPAPAKSPNLSKAGKVVARHMKLARVLNAIYLQLQLDNNKIDEFDVIAGLWDVKDRSVIEKLVSLKVDGLNGSLASLEQVVNGFPNDVKEIADVEGITKKMESIKQITSEKREAMRKATEKDAIPSFLTKKFPDYDFQKNLASDALKDLEVAKNENFNVKNFINILVNLSLIRQNLPLVFEWLKKINGELKKTHSLVEGYRAVIEAQSKSNDLNELSTLFANVEKSLPSLKRLKSMEGIVDIQHQFAVIQNSLLLFHQVNQSLSIASAFISSSDRSSIHLDLKDEWIMKILRKDLKNLEIYLENVEKMMTGFITLDQYQNNLTSFEHIDNLKSISDSLLASVDNFQKNAGHYTLASSTSCFKTTDSKNNPSLSGLETLSSDLAKLLEVVPAMLESLKDIATLDRDAQECITEINTVNATTFSDWISGSGIEEFSKKVKRMENVFKSLQQDDAMAASIKRLSESKDQLQSLQKQISEFPIIKKECDPIFNFDVTPFISLNSIPETIQIMKSEKSIEKIKPLLATIPKLSAELKKLKPSSTKSYPPKTNPPKTATQKPPANKKSKRSTDTKKFVSQNPQSLLDVAISVRGLEQMDLIASYNSHLEIIITKGAEVEKSIGTVKNPTKKAELLIVWQGFPELKVKLEAIKANNKEVLAKIKSVEPEEDLKKFGEFYAQLSFVKPTERVELQGLRMSMKLLNKPDPELIDALEKLEKPLATNWQLTQVSFKRLPSAMIGLQSDFEAFFGGEEENAFLKFLKDYMLLLCIGGGVLIFVLILLLVFLYWWKKIRDPDMKKKLERDVDFDPSVESMSMEFDFMQYQDSRFDINKRNDMGHTKIFQALIDRKFQEVEDLMNAGAILDAACGVNSRTVLTEAAAMKERNWCQTFLDAGADPDIYDYLGHSLDHLAEYAGATTILQEYRNRMPKRFRVLPHEERRWKILIMDPSVIKLGDRKKLPLRFKKNATWGYKKGMNLDDFSTIVIPKKFVKGNENDEEMMTLVLNDDDDMIRWKLYACDAVLTHPNWLKELIGAHNDRKKQAYLMQEDYLFFILNVEYKNKLQLKSVVNVKNAIHQMVPRLLEGVSITLLPTKDPKVLKKQETWKELIKAFGGKLTDTPVGDSMETARPYHACSTEYFEEKGYLQNSCWILKYKDSEVNPEYLSDWDKYTCVDFEFLPECMARFHLLPTNNTVVPLAKNDTTLNVVESSVRDTTDGSKINSVVEKAKPPTNNTISASSTGTSRSTVQQPGQARPRASRERCPGSVEPGVEPRSIAGPTQKPHVGAKLNGRASKDAVKNPLRGNDTKTK